MHNIGFAICGVEGSCVESFGNFSRKKSFRCHFFRNLVSGNFFCFMQFLIEISVVKARTSQSRFPLAASITEPYDTTDNERNH